MKYFNTPSGKLIYNPINLNDFKEFREDFEWAKSSSIENPLPTPIKSQATIETMAYLEIGKNNDAPFSLVASSQGTVITHNALLGFWSLNDDNKKYLKNRVRVCHIGLVFPEDNINTMQQILNKYKSCINERDRLASILSLGEGWEESLKDEGGMHSIRWYLPLAKKHFRFYKKENVVPFDQPFIERGFFYEPQPQYQKRNFLNSTI